MPDPASASWVLLAAILTSVAAMGWLALSMPAHAAQAWGRAPKFATRRVLRRMGIVGIVIALLLCLHVDHATMAVLVWVMALSGAALLVAFMLAAHPGWMRWLAPWVRAPARPAR